MSLTYISTYASNCILDFQLGRENTIVPSFFYVAFSSSPLGNDGAGLVEPNDLAYERVEIPNTKDSFTEALNKVVSLKKDFIFNETSTDWLRMTHFSIFDDLNNVWFYGELQDSFDAQIASSPILDATKNSFRLDICGGSTGDMAMTTKTANNILNHFLGGSTDYNPPVNYYIGVSSTPISTEGIGATEPSAPEYQRLVIPNDKNSFTLASNKAVTLAKEFKFNEANITWGNMPYFFISDTPTGESVLWSGKLIHPRNVEIATTLVIKPNGFNWTLGLC